MKLLAALALIAVCGAAGSVAYYFGYVLPHSRHAERIDALRTKEEERVLEAARACKEDGMKFYAGFQQAMNTKETTWDDPEFHFSKKLNTCLVRTRYIQTLYGTISFQYNQVTDIYANSALLYGWFKRDTSVNPFKETLMDTTEPDKPNYTSAEYFAAKNKLFGE